MVQRRGTWGCGGEGAGPLAWDNSQEGERAGLPARSLLSGNLGE